MSRGITLIFYLFFRGIPLIVSLSHYVEVLIHSYLIVSVEQSLHPGTQAPGRRYRAHDLRQRCQSVTGGWPRDTLPGLILSTGGGGMLCKPGRAGEAF